MSTQGKLRAVVAATTLSLILAACGQDETTDQPTAEVETPDEAPEAEVPDEAEAPDDPAANAADVEFVRGMIPHHLGAIEMSELVPERTERQELVDLAEEIIAVQDAEIDQLRGMIEHHEGAIDMAERVQAEGSDPEVADLAEAVVAAQEAEIDQMNQWLDEWDLA
jgi:uncharacterized protein (DUF305 family)